MGRSTQHEASDGPQLRGLGHGLYVEWRSSGGPKGLCGFDSAQPGPIQELSQVDGDVPSTCLVQEVALAMDRIYADHAATTPLLPEAYAAMGPWLTN